MDILCLVYYNKISYFKIDIFLTYDVIFDVIFNIDNRVHRLAKEFLKVFLLINRFKIDFKSVHVLKIVDFAENRQNDVIFGRK